MSNGKILIISYLFITAVICSCGVKEKPSDTDFHNAVEKGRTKDVQKYIRNGYDVNVRGRNNATALHYAAENCRVFVAKLLINAGAEIDSKDDYGRSPLHYAAKNNNSKIASILIKKGAIVNLKDKSGRTPFDYAVTDEKVQKNVAMVLINKGADVNILYAVLFNELKFIKKIANKAKKINIQDSYGRTALHVAVQKKNIPVIKFLIRKGVDISHTTKKQFYNSNLHKGSTALHYAVYTDSVKIAELLIKHGAKINQKDGEGWTPLKMAAWKRSKKSIKLLKDKGAVVDDVYTASMIGDSEALFKMIKEGSSIDDYDLYGSSPLHYASGRGHAEAVRLLLKHGVEVDIKKTFTHITPLHWADNVEVAQILVEHGADVNSGYKYKSTPLHHALSDMKIEIVKYLLRKNAKVNGREEFSLNTPLHEAVVNYRIPKKPKDKIVIVKMILDAGAEINAQNKSGETSLGLALEHSNDEKYESIKYELVKLLLERGADPYISADYMQAPIDRAQETKIENLLKKYEKK